MAEKSEKNKEKKQKKEISKNVSIKGSDKVSKKKSDTVIVGIDLGTTNSLVAIPNSAEKPVIIPNERGERTTPSVVTIQADSVLVGELARCQAVLNHDITISQVKRSVGTDRKWKIQGKEWSPEEISSEILKNLKAIAETYLGKLVNDAVITVPAYFNDKQREVTMKAGILAGFQVHKLFNEPTAAALAYGMQRNDDDHLLVFDFGGGTLDITLLEVKDKAFLVRGVGGDSKLGGIDFDSLIVDYVNDSFKEIHGLNLKEDPVAYQQLLNQAENAKVDISAAQETRIMIPYVAVTKKGPLHLNVKLTRDTFNNLAKPVLEKIHAIIHDTLEAAKLEKEWVKSLVLVGGSSRIPCVKNLLVSHLPENVQVRQDLNPEEIVAMGSGILAGVLNGHYPEVVIRDIISHDLGIEDDKGDFIILIPRGTVYPVENCRMFTTTKDSQKEVTVRILQKEVLEEKLISLGYFTVEGLSEGKAGELDIPITFNIDKNGILMVKAEEGKSGVKREIKVRLDF